VHRRPLVPYNGSMRVMVAAFVLLAISACSAPAQTSVAPSSLIALPTLPPAIGLPSGAQRGCRGVGIDAVLRGNATDPWVAWLVTSGGARLNPYWPSGYRARFTPNLEILDATGGVVLRSGAHLSGACENADRLLFLEPPFN
jgi:hypothetical protein